MIEYDNDSDNGYYIKPSEEAMYFPNRQAHLFVKGQNVGVSKNIKCVNQIFGIVHPKVLQNFDIKYPVSLAEIDMELIFSMAINGEILKKQKKERKEKLLKMN